MQGRLLGGLQGSEEMSFHAGTGLGQVSDHGAAGVGQDEDTTPSVGRVHLAGESAAVGESVRLYQWARGGDR